MKGGETRAQAKNTDDRLKVRGQKTKKTKDPNKPKRPPSAFFVFLDEFRQEFNKANPDNKSVANVGRAAGARWKSLTDEDKVPYVEKAQTKKTEYAKSMQQYNMKLANGTNTSDKTEGGASEEEEDAE